MSDSDIRCDHCGLRLRDCARIAKSGAQSLAAIKADEAGYRTLKERPDDLYAIAFEKGAAAALEVVRKGEL